MPETLEKDLDLTTKHPLQYCWTLWYRQGNSNLPWEESMIKVMSFKTVEDFWAMYRHIQLASGLPHGSDYYLFKEGVQPMWEDPANKQGGRWLITIDRLHRNVQMDEIWCELLMAMVGEQFDGLGASICGAVVNVRQKGDKISLWTSNAIDDEGNTKIGLIVKKKLGLQELITYEAHEDTSQKNSSMVKSRLRV